MHELVTCDIISPAKVVSTKKSILSIKMLLITPASSFQLLSFFTLRKKEGTKDIISFPVHVYFPFCIDTPHDCSLCEILVDQL